MKVVGAVLAGIGAFLLIYMALGWVLMLTLGGLHNSVWSDIPALGFWPSVLVAYALGLVGSLLGLNHKS